MSADLLVPNAKAGAEALPPGYEACGCCDGVMPSTPQPGANRIGLGSIRYRIGDQAQIKASLIAGLSSASLPALAGLRTREAGDFTLGLIDAFACAADVLAFYQERIANESYLRTAGERVSMQELGRLIGYRLKPGVAAETLLAFALETPPVAPAALPPEPGNFVTGVPSLVALDIGLKVQSVPGPGEKPQTFETVEAIEARPVWNAMRPWLSELRRPGRGARETYFAGIRTGLEPGDAIVLLDGDFRARGASDRWDFRVLDSVSPDTVNQRTRVTWSRGLGSISPWMDPAQQPEAFALRKRASVYGHNAPQWRSMPFSYRLATCNGVLACANGGDWPGLTLSPAGATTSGGHVDLDAVNAKVVAGGFVVLARSGYIELFEVLAASEISRSDFALSGKTSRLQLRGENYVERFQSQVRETTVHVQSEALAFAPYPVTAAVSGDTVAVAVAAEGLHAGRRLMVRGIQVGSGAALVHACTLLSVTVVDSARCTLRIDPPLPAALVRDSVVVHANVALASHGESVAQILGNGDASRAFQRFELKQLPLTHRAAASESGTRSELVLRVGDIQWQEVRSLHALAPDQRAFRLDLDEQGRQWLRFGDGINGARLPSGVNNIRAAYRKGIGAEGNVRAETLTQAASRPLGLKSVANLLPASGGSDAEAPDAARETMPLTVRTLGRAVSVLDYADFARAFAGIAKAQAAVLQLAAGPTVAVTVAGANGTLLLPTNPVWQNLLAALKAGGDPHVPLRLLSYQPGSFRVGLKVKVDPVFDAAGVLAAVEAALRSGFGFAARELGQPVQQSEVIACVHRVAGVVAVDLDLLYGGSLPTVQTLPSRQVRLLASRMRAVAGVALPAQLLTLDAAPLDRLELMP